VIYDRTLFWAVDLLEDFCKGLEQQTIVRGVACFNKKSPGVEQHMEKLQAKRVKKYGTY